MCGRFALTPKTNKVEKLLPESKLILTNVPRYNIAPGSNVNCIINKSGKFAIGEFLWGLIPSWSKDNLGAFNLFNAKCETLDEKPSFKYLINRNRALIPATGFYEWKKETPKTKTPYYFHLNDMEVFAFAGLFDKWKNSAGQTVYSVTIITTEANSIMKPIHDRMPVIIDNNSAAEYLNHANNINDFLRSYNSRKMKSYQVDRFVNSALNDGELCTKPL
jgi:putative SOS response-associated peptidase YedK